MSIKDNEHRCDYMPGKGVYISFDDDEEPSWTLTVQREASLQDVEANHFLDMVGAIIWCTEIEIICCPFCGEALPSLEGRDKDTYGVFRHIDSTGWSSKLL